MSIVLICGHRASYPLQFRMVVLVMVFITVKRHHDTATFIKKIFNWGSLTYNFRDSVHDDDEGEHESIKASVVLKLQAAAG